MIISIIVCTYNRSELLKETLPSILGLAIPTEIQPEFIFVDNNSSDDTQGVINEFISILNESEKYLTARYVFEGNQGLSFARNKGYSESNGDYIELSIASSILSSESPVGLWMPAVCSETM